LPVDPLIFLGLWLLICVASFLMGLRFYRMTEPRGDFTVDHARRFGRLMMILVEPTKSGRWTWHGVLICTGHEHQPSILKEFRHLAPHDVLKKWLYVDSRHRHFERTMERVAQAIARDDERFGIQPRLKKRSRTRSHE